MEIDNGVYRKIDKPAAEAKMAKRFNLKTPRNVLEYKGIIGVLRALREFDGEAKRSVIINRAKELVPLDEKEKIFVSESDDGDPVGTAFGFSMTNLKKAGYIESPSWGVWRLTEIGANVDLAAFDVWDDVYRVTSPVWEKTEEKKRSQLILVMTVILLNCLLTIRKALGMRNC